MAKFYVFLRTWAHDVVNSTLVPGQVASISQVKQISIIAEEIQKRKVICWNDGRDSKPATVRDVPLEKWGVGGGVGKIQKQKTRKEEVKKKKPAE